MSAHFLCRICRIWIEDEAYTVLFEDDFATRGASV